MNYERVTAVYFSPTGTSKRGVRAIAKEFSEEAEDMDLTLWNSVPGRVGFGPDELVVFGAPVYAGRLYAGAVKRLRRLRGQGTPCIITVTYGNRDYDDALLELKDLVKELGFQPIAAAALVGQHTYGDIQVGRPNAGDIMEDREFADRIRQKDLRNLQEVEVPGSRPYREGGGGGHFRVLTNDSCTHCGRCIRECTEGAIAAEDPSSIDPAKCIACFRCIRLCPVQAKNADTPEYRKFAEGFNERLKTRRENQYFL